MGLLHGQRMDGVHDLVEFLVQRGHVLLDAVQSGADRHRFGVAAPIDAAQIAARLAECLVEPSLQLL